MRWWYRSTLLAVGVGAAGTAYSAGTCPNLTGTYVCEGAHRSVVKIRSLSAKSETYYEMQSDDVLTYLPTDGVEYAQAAPEGTTATVRHFCAGTALQSHYVSRNLKTGELGWSFKIALHLNTDGHLQRHIFGKVWEENRFREVNHLVTCRRARTAP